MEKCFILWREKQSVISETYVTHRFEIRSIIGIIRTVTEAYESHRMSPISPIAFIALKPPEHGLGINMRKKSKLYLKV